jgi:branched-chain amino acid transport system permease protein
MLGAFIAFMLAEILALGYIASFLITAAALIVIGAVVELIVFRPLLGDEIATVICSLGLAIFIVGLMEAIMGPDAKPVNSPFKGVLSISGISLSKERMALISIATLSLLAFYIWVSFTRYGRALRATASDSNVAAACGINISLIYSLTFGIATGLAGIAGVLMAPIVGLTPEMGWLANFKAFIVVIFGGLGSIPGAVLAGLLLGLIESIITTSAGATTADLASFGIILLMLLIRPWGLLGKEVT